MKMKPVTSATLFVAFTAQLIPHHAYPGDLECFAPDQCRHDMHIETEYAVSVSSTAMPTITAPRLPDSFF